MAYVGRDPRVRKALVVAWSSTVMAIALACGSGLRHLFAGNFGSLFRSYEPTLAVLTATLIAIIWYTFFTFRVAIPQSVVRLVPAVIFDPELGTLEVIIENRSTLWLDVRPKVSIWFDHHPKELPAALGGVSMIHLAPEGMFSETLLYAEDLRPGSKFFDVCIRICLSWRNEYDVEGIEDPRYWRVDLRGTRKCISVYGPEEIEGLLVSVGES